MSVEILGAEAQQRMRVAGEVAAATLAHVAGLLRAGIPTAHIDRWVREDTARRGGRPSQLGYQGFPAAVCTSRNQVVCHGIPAEREIVHDGDIINVDVTTEIGGYHGDTSATFVVGDASPEARRLVLAARRCRDAGVAVVRPGARLGDIGAAIEEAARREGCSVVREYGGHGIGRVMHAPPHVSHTGKRGQGLRLKAGMAFTIEPMINLGEPDTRLLPDRWTVVTADGSLSAQFEHTVLVTDEGCEILTAGRAPLRFEVLARIGRHSVPKVPPAWKLTTLWAEGKRTTTSGSLKLTAKEKSEGSLFCG
jgi:methionyl aminopeptidase